MAVAVVSFVVGAVVPVFSADAVLTRNANLRRDPSTVRPPIRRLVPPDEVEIIDPTPTNGYFHVRDEDHEEGWVWGGSIRILPDTGGTTAGPTTGPTSHGVPVTIASAISPQWDKPTPNQTEFEGADGTCGPTGDGGDRATNLRKKIGPTFPAAISQSPGAGTNDSRGIGSR